MLFSLFYWYFSPTRGEIDNSKKGGNRNDERKNGSAGALAWAKQKEGGGVLVKAPKLPYWPQVVIPSARVPRHCWLAWRRSGIGGSDVAKILGVCPFGTCRDLYYDKKGIVNAEDEEANRWQKHIGTVLEDTVAAMFSEHTGFPIFKVPYMFRSPEHPFMLADVDYFCILPDGSIALVECKTTSPDAIGKWWAGKKQVIPLNYQLQGRHYMSVLKLNKVFFTCLYGNSEAYLIIRELDRDLVTESELIFLESDFWHNNVLAGVPPPYLEAGHLCEESARRHHGPGDADAPHIILPQDVGLLVPQYIALNEAKNAYVKQMDSALKTMKAGFIDCMGKSTSASCVVDGQKYVLTFTSNQTARMPKAELDKLRYGEPEMYEKYVRLSVERKFYAKVLQDDEAAADAEETADAA